MLKNIFADIQIFKENIMLLKVKLFLTKNKKMNEIIIDIVCAK